MGAETGMQKINRVPFINLTEGSINTFWRKDACLSFDCTLIVHFISKQTCFPFGLSIFLTTYPPVQGHKAKLRFINM